MKYIITKEIDGKTIDIELTDTEARRIYYEVQRDFMRSDIDSVIESNIMDNEYTEEELKCIEDHKGQIYADYQKEMEDCEDNEYWDIALYAINKVLYEYIEGRCN